MFNKKLFVGILHTLNQLLDEQKETNRLLKLQNTILLMNDSVEEEPLKMEYATPVMIGDLFEMETVAVIFEGKRYVFNRLGMDISESLGRKQGEVTLTHEIIGFEEPLYMVIDNLESTFTFALKIAETGLYVSLQDEEIHKKAVELVVSLNGGEEDES